MGGTRPEVNRSEVFRDCGRMWYFNYRENSQSCNSNCLPCCTLKCSQWVQSTRIQWSSRVRQASMLDSKAHISFYYQVVAKTHTTHSDASRKCWESVLRPSHLLLFKLILYEDSVARKWNGQNGTWDGQTMEDWRLCPNLDLFPPQHPG